mgnify:FL=1|tara:strand:- start:1360 stop:1695 length:336 start_codon:yes stop_codon:yes gene_type:complete
MAMYKNNLSYEQYMKEGLMMLSSNLGLKTYKRAGGDPQLKMTFDKNLDYRVLFTWKGEAIPNSQFIVDRQFWRMSNRNDGDRNHMRRWADPKLESVKDAIERGKKKKKKNG